MDWSCGVSSKNPESLPASFSQRLRFVFAGGNPRACRVHNSCHDTRIGDDHDTDRARPHEAAESLLERSDACGACVAKRIAAARLDRSSQFAA